MSKSKKVRVKDVIRLMGHIQRFRVGNFKVHPDALSVDITSRRLKKNKLILELANGQRVVLTVKVS